MCLDGTDKTHPDPDGNAETLVARLMSVASVSELMLVTLDTLDAGGAVTTEVMVCVR
jgi:hypothetical protein